MAELPETVKLFILDCLACFDRPKQVLDKLTPELLEALDIKPEGFTAPTPQQLSAYDPATVAGSRLSEEHKAFFRDRRERFLTQIEEIPISNLAFRMKGYQEIYDHPKFS